MSYVVTGFPSPADDYIDIGINLNKQLIQNPASTFFLRAKGHSMTKSGVQDGDVVIVDRSLNPIPMNIVIATFEGNFIIREFTYKQGSFYLETNDQNHHKINLNKYSDVQIWGVAIYSIHKLNKHYLSKCTTR